MRLAPVVLLIAAGAPPAPAADPAVAVLSPDKSDRAGLLEARLLAEPGMTLVERAAVDAVLKEQALQAVFGPQGVGDRVRLGKVLKADALVLVRAAKGAEPPALEVVVSETAGGLRLRVGGVPVTADAAADAAALRDHVRAAVGRLAGGVREVVAVPPFVSRDLTYEHDHLKGALARLAEAAAVGRPGVLAVELAEAEALAKELALAAPGTTARRPLPVYLLGEYRNEGRGADRRLTLTLRAERGGKPVGGPATRTVPPADAPAAVRGWAAAAAGGGSGGSPPDPKAEAKQLAARAADFRRLGQWDEALALAEASLLLVPDQAALRRAAVETVAARIARMGRPAEQDAAVAREAHALYRRGVDHLAGHVRANTQRGQSYRIQQLWSTLRGSVHVLHGSTLAPPAVQALGRETLEYERAVLAPLADSDAVERGGSAFHPLVTRGMTPADRYAYGERLARRLVRLPTDDLGALYDLIREFDPEKVDPGMAAHFGFLARVEALGDKRVNAVTANQRGYMARVLKERAALAAGTPIPAPAPAPPPPPADTGPDPKAVRFHPVPVTLAGGGPPPARLAGVQAAGPGADLFWDYGGVVYLMTERGVLRKVWDRPADSPDGARGWHRVQTACFDGRYAWVTVQNAALEPAGATGVRQFKRETASLLAIDPAAGTVWEFAAADGLPGPPVDAPVTRTTGPALWAVPLAPGRAGVVGVFGGGRDRRVWAGVATVGAGRKAVAVVHEAVEPPAEGKGQGQRTTVAHFPDLVAVLRGAPGPGGGPPPTRLLVGRGESGPKFGARPLLIDPDARTVAVAPYPNLVAASDPFAPDPNRHVDGAVYYFERRLEKPFGGRLVRVAFPGTEKEAVFQWPQATDHTWQAVRRVVPHAGRVYLLEGRTEVVEPLPPGAPTYLRPKTARYDVWWKLDRGGKEPRPAAARLPTALGVGESSHYGLLAVAEGVPAGSAARGEAANPLLVSTLYRVEIDDPPPGK